MSNFDLRKYLKENKWTYNDSKSINHTFGKLNEKEELDEKAPQMKKSPKNDRLNQIIKQLEVLSDDNSTFNKSEVKKVQAAVKKLRTVWFK